MNSDIDNTTHLLRATNISRKNTSGVDSPGSSIFDLPVHHGDSTPSSSRPKSRSPFRATDSDVASSTLGPSLTISCSGEQQQQQPKSPSFLVISGGSGCNSICSAFGDACYVLPVSDDGGSSSEIIRVLGGPSIGDIRSRLVRLIPSSPPGTPLDRIRHLLAYRLKTESTEREARDEWRDIVEGRSTLWDGIPPDRKEVIRGFLVYFESEVLRRAQKNFSFRNGSVGNYFLAAARIFFRSLPSAIFLFSSITSSQANIIPALVTNHTVTIAAELENSRTIVGQCNISHPVQSEMPFSFALTESSPTDGVGSEDFGTISDRVQTSNLAFSKTTEDKEEPLESRINRIFYINAYGHEIRPSPNPDFLTQCQQKDILVYSCGSLWTSIIPCLALKGVASAIGRSHTLQKKILLLNSRNDRESGGYTAVDYINAIVRTLNTNYDNWSPFTSYPISAFITHLVYLKGGMVPLDVTSITTMGVHCVEVEAKMGDDKHRPMFDAECVQSAIKIIMKEW